MGSRSMLQGTPWHEEQMKRTCKNGSKYCVYNKNICVCTHSKFHHKKCVGKGECEDFESKGGTPKVQSSITIPITTTKVEVLKTKGKTNMSNNTNDNNSKESKKEKFLRISKGRIDKIEEAIGNLENLSDKYSYTYTDEQVEKMFDYLQGKLDDAKSKFLNQDNGFEW